MDAPNLNDHCQNHKPLTEEEMEFVNLNKYIIEEAQSYNHSRYLIIYSSPTEEGSASMHKNNTKKLLIIRAFIMHKSDF